MILEYIKTDGLKVAVNMFEIAAVEQKEDYTLLILRTGHEIEITEHASNVTVEMLQELRDRGQA